MKSQRKVAVVGAGSWGTAVASIFADAGSQTLLWARDAHIAAHIEEKKENPKYLAGIPLCPQLHATADLAHALEWGEVIVCSIPTQHIRSVFAPHAEKLAGKRLVNTSKGIEMKTLARVSEIFAQIAPTASYVVLSGPSFADEVARRLPTAVTMASADRAAAQEIQQAMGTSYFRGYTSQDVVGVEFAGALKNVVAIASGMVSGLRLGHNAQAAVINRGMAEIARLGKKRGAESMTFLGLAGMGDLVLTCTGPLSRNRRVGILLGEGHPLEAIRPMVGGVAEGVFTAQSAFELSRALDVEVPILRETYRILYEGGSPRDAVGALMGRDLKEEW